METTATGQRSASRLVLGGVALAAALFVGSLVGLAALMGGASGCGGGAEPLQRLGHGVPARLVPIYDGASERFHLGPRGPTVLAAINYVETDFGANAVTSGAGAVGWMQFLPSTFATWGVDGDGDGVKDPDDPDDAIFAAANYLHASGAPGDWSEAIFAYNHAGWYVEEVLADAKKFAEGPNAELARSSAGLVGCGGAAVAPNEAVAAMVAEADRLSALRPHTEYVWGGSHGLTPTPPNGPFDCSSAVSHELQVGGFENETMATPALASWGKPGPGLWVTIFVKPYDDAEGAAHTFLRFSADVTPPDERYWGTSGFVESGHGPGWIPESTFSASYLSGFMLRHPPGL